LARSLILCFRLVRPFRLDRVTKRRNASSDSVPACSGEGRRSSYRYRNFMAMNREYPRIVVFARTELHDLGVRVY